MQSFDVFDTLVARKCIHPDAVFSLVEAELGLPGFAAMRIDAERCLHGREHQIDDIYAQLRARFDLPAEALSFAKERELLHELDQVIPIARNLCQVRDGDVLVSDTYLPAAFLGQLLERAGLRRVVSIVRSASGKATGRIWRSLAESGGPTRHLGDNPNSDGDMARRYGFEATISGVSQPTPEEAHLLKAGYTGIALLARILRLGIADDDPVALALQEAQANLNIPILLLASMDLSRRIAQCARAPDRILFSSRDSRHWFRLFRNLPVPSAWARECDVRYFLTSRVARVSASPDYVAYFRDQANDKSLVVDLCGTGLSLTRLYAAAGIKPGTHFLYRIREGAITERYRTAFATNLVSDATALIDSSDGVGNIVLELMNATGHGMTTDAIEIPHAPQPTFLPRLAESEFSVLQTGWLDRMASVVEAAVEWFADPYLEEKLRQEASLSDLSARAAVLPLLGRAEATTVLAESFLQTHLESDFEICSRLDSLGH